MSKDYYKILGIERDASPVEIKKAYRKMALEHHPDKNQVSDSDEKIKEINEAYEVLKDLQKKAGYDQFGTADGQPHFNQGFGGGTHEFRGDINDMDDILRNFMRGRGGFEFNQAPAKNPDYTASIVITLEEAFSGKENIINTPDLGSGSSTINFKIPPGVHNGITLRLQGKGSNQHSNLPSGDLHISINIAKHPKFTVVGLDIFCNEKISMIDAALGTKIDVLTVDGKTLNVKIPAGTQPNQKIRLKGEGWCQINNPTLRGDFYINANVIIPDSLTEKQKEILNDFKNA